MSAEHHEPGIHLTGLSEDPEKREEEIQWVKLNLQIMRKDYDRNDIKFLGTKVIEGIPLQEHESYYLGKALIDLSEGKSVREAFKLAAGRPRDDNKFLRNLKLTTAIFEFMENGMSLEKASYEVGEKFNVSEHTAAKAYKGLCKMIQNSESGKRYIDSLENNDSFNSMIIKQNIKVKNLDDYLP